MVALAQSGTAKNVGDLCHSNTLFLLRHVQTCPQAAPTAPNAETAQCAAATALGAAQQQGAPSAEQPQNQALPPLQASECGAFARRIGRFLGCGEGVEECSGDRPAHLVAKAALRR